MIREKILRLISAIDILIIRGLLVRMIYRSLSKDKINEINWLNG